MIDYSRRVADLISRSNVTGSMETVWTDVRSGRCSGMEIDQPTVREIDGLHGEYVVELALEDANTLDSHYDGEPDDAFFDMLSERSFCDIGRKPRTWSVRRLSHTRFRCVPCGIET